MTMPCRSCHAGITFVRLNTGKPMPIDPVPNERGNVAARREGRTLVGYVISQARPLQAGYDTYMPHKATCHDKPRVTAAQRTPALFDA